MNFLPSPENLVWLIPLPPLVAFFVILLFTRGSRLISDLVAVGAILLTWAISIIVLIGALTTEHLGEHPFEQSIVWLPLGDAAETSFRMGALVDPLGAVLLFFVPLTATMIFIYSTGYMAGGHYWTAIIPGKKHEYDEHIDHTEMGGHGDDMAPHGEGQEVMVDSAGRTITRFPADAWKARFMAFIALFAGGMLLLSIADNLLLLFVGWEIMGLCSYLLIGFWNNKVYPNQPDRITPPFAAIKAFMTTRIGDMFMLIGIAWLYALTGTLNFREIFFNEETMHMLETTPAWLGWSAAAWIGVLMLLGTVGKSAQFPLHTWLPDAMEGPTPVSAMIHAATMVSAGVYLLIRLFPLLSLGWHEHELSIPMMAMAFIGSFTALFAATIALAQRDVKKVLAYSTISQLGFMVAALGIGAFVAAAFHLMTHAIFKALLFMGSGSVIHAVEHGEEHAHHHGHHFPPDFDAQDMFNMGGLWRRIPVTAWTFLIGGLALSGFPFITAGFWSKDEILADAFAHERWIVFGVLAFTAFLTAFYTMRKIGLTFFGAPRTAAADEASQPDWRMNLPLLILAFFAITAGWVGIPAAISPFGVNPFHDFVAGTLAEHPEAIEFNFTPMLVSIVVALLGLGLGWLVYIARPVREGQVDPVARVLGPIYTLFQNKYYVDQAYYSLFVRTSQWFAETVAYRLLDRTIIDGVLHFIARATEWLAFRNKDFDTYIVNGAGDEVAVGVGNLGKAFRYLQSGRVQQYLAVGAAGLLMLAGVFIWAFFLR